VNGSIIKFFYKNQPMSQVQTLRPKYYKKVMNTPTNSVEVIPLELRMQRKKNGFNVREFWTLSGRRDGKVFFLTKSIPFFPTLILEP
jgi:hypothetical protein